MAMIDIEKQLEIIARRAASSLDTLWCSYRMGQNLGSPGREGQVPGDIVECGVYHGAQCAAFALGLAHSWRPGDRKVHLFDSFDGVPAPTSKDQDWIQAGHPVGISKATLDEVKANMKEWGVDESLLVYHAGMFVDSMYDSILHGIKSIAVLRLDADLYESTWTALAALYPLVSPGGWVVVDDYALDGCRLAVGNYFAGRRDYPGPIYFQRQS